MLYFFLSVDTYISIDMHFGLCQEYHIVNVSSMNIGNIVETVVLLSFQNHPFGIFWLDSMGQGTGRNSRFY